jgi:hypothetical protein
MFRSYDHLQTEIYMQTTNFNRKNIYARLSIDKLKLSYGISLQESSATPKSKDRQELVCRPRHQHKSYSCECAFSVVFSKDGKTRRLTAGNPHSLMSTDTIRMQPDFKCENCHWHQTGCRRYKVQLHVPPDGLAVCGFIPCC